VPSKSSTHTAMSNYFDLGANLRKPRSAEGLTFQYDRKTNK